MSDRTSIEDRRQRLSTRIQSYNSKGSVLMEIETGTDLEVVVAPVSFDEDTILDEGEDEDEDDVASDDGNGDYLDGPGEEGEDEDEVAEGPERMQVIMPSSFNRADITRLGLENLAHQKLELQQGQANDALEHLHLALGQKALLWCTKVTPTKSTPRLGMISKLHINKWRNMLGATIEPKRPL